MTFTVVLHVYDLSNGMAKMFSQSLIGKQIEGIWHSGIVVYDREWYFGGGILNDRPLATPYGRPVQVINLGTTEITSDLFKEFLDGVRDRFRMDTYHLLENNCNHFTNECSQFLLGQPIPDHIVGLPREVLNTPFGMMIHQQNWGTMMGPVNNNNNNNNQPKQLPPPSTSSTTTTTSSSISHPKLNNQHWHSTSKLTLPLLMNNKPILFEKGDIDSVFSKLLDFVKFQPTIDMQSYQDNSKSLLSIIKNSSPSITIPLHLLTWLESLIKILPESNLFPVLEIIRFIILKNDGNRYFIQNPSNTFLSTLLDKMISNQLSKQSELITLRLIVNSFLNKQSIDYIFSKYLSKLVECTTRGLNSNDKVLKRAVSTVAYNLSLYLSVSQHDDQITSLLASLHHVLTCDNKLAEDPEIDFRLLMAFGTLLYCCSDNTMDMIKMLEFDPIQSKYKSIADCPNNINQLIQEIHSLIK
ncbi:hypothetical protein DFA_10353 [Cavenderia fasciculata]|uniref:PPPDE domain-containing protein n=1 Tax=Cavenderia fasciculata TaxID=261658 RepID=F4Q9Z2_CACFS|nr:uncharacterized protein DFA_10353 [Cavenderia fasciculata]EGG15511.1 hypothetical protein DFA_10353 [Cavenderia fasciculata]|eukprot:XP_004354253.1 hypothetical protein DFA_10353 [Cavenderia fasciculata]